jgi:segregation and condensation protein B
MSQLKENDDYNFNFNQKQNIVEAIIFSSSEPVSFKALEKIIPDNVLLLEIINSLEKKYISSGINLFKINNTFAFRTSFEVAEFLNIEKIIPKPLSRAASETLAIIAYHQPITRSEIENIRGVSLSKGTLDLLFELTWIKPGHRRLTPGRPLTWITSNSFLDHFGLKSISELPGIDDLKNSGLLEKDNILFNDADYDQ